MATVLPPRKLQAPVSSVTTFKSASQIDDKPDYDALYLDPHKEAEYRRKKQQGFYHKTGAEFDVVLATVLSNGKSFKKVFEERFGWTPDCMDDIHEGAQIVANDNEIELFKLFNEVIIDLGFVNDNNVSTLCCIAREGQDNIIRYLIDEKGINFNYIAKYTPQPTDDEQTPAERVGGLPISSAGYYAQESTIKLLVSKGVWLSGVDRDNDTALHSLLLSKYKESTPDELQHKQHAVKVAHELIQLYGKSTPFNKPHQKLSFKHNKNATSPLGGAMVMLYRVHSLLKTKGVNGEDLYEKLKPFTRLCHEIRLLSKESYALAPADIDGALINVCAYTTSVDKSSRADYVRDLYRADRSFVTKVYLDCQSALATGAQSLDDIAELARHISDIDRQQTSVNRVM